MSITLRQRNRIIAFIISVFFGLLFHAQGSFAHGEEIEVSEGGAKGPFI